MKVTGIKSEILAICLIDLRRIASDNILPIPPHKRCGCYLGAEGTGGSTARKRFTGLVEFFDRARSLNAAAL